VGTTPSISVGAKLSGELELVLDVLQDLIQEVQLPVYIAGVRIVGAGTAGEGLLVVPL